MQNSAYLSRSRHGIFYFRWPISRAIHPKGLRSDVKLSLDTRCPRRALTLARLLMGTAATGIAGAARHMRYDEIRQHVREHFQTALAAFKERVASDGMPTAQSLEAMQNSLDLDKADLLAAMGTSHPDGEAGILRRFLSLRGVSEEVPADRHDMMLQEYHAGFQAYFREAFTHLRTFDAYDLTPAQPVSQQPAPAPAIVASEDAPPAVNALPLSFAETVAAYMAEGRSSSLWTTKTMTTKTEKLRLLGELTGNRPVSELNKADARHVKNVLLRMPKNRNKMPQTRDLSIEEASKLTGVSTAE